MDELSALESLYEAAEGSTITLPDELARIYGDLRLPSAHATRPHIIGNFVSTLDGVVSLNVPGQAGGGAISGFNQHDRVVMGILRSVADAVVVGAGTLRAVPHHRWTAEYLVPSLADAYRRSRLATGRSGPPLNVIVTSRGAIDLGLPVFNSDQIPVLIVTTEQGARNLQRQPLPSAVQVRPVQSDGPILARQVLTEIDAIRPSTLVLVEGGPRLFGDFIAERCLDELFLTIAPQVAGRDHGVERPGLVAGKIFAPANPLWGKLVSLRRADNHLFLRYAFPAE